MDAQTLPPHRLPWLVVILVVLALICVSLAIGLSLMAGATLLAPECGTGTASFLDELRVRLFAPGVFPSSLWKESYAVADFRITRTWLADTYGAVAYLDYLIYNCGHTPADLNAYFSAENFTNILLRDYENPQHLDTCSAGNLTLYIYRARFNDQDFLTHTWVQPDGSKRIIDFFLAFPASQQAEMVRYAEKIFPSLPTCR